MMHFYEMAAIVPSLDERERQQLLKDSGSLKAVAGLNAEILVKRFGKRKGNAATRDVQLYREGKSAARRPLIVPISLLILIGLFAIQSRGTGKIGRMFGPIIVLWFIAMGALSPRRGPR